MNVDPTTLPYGLRPLVHLCVRQGCYAETDGRLYAVRVDDDRGELVISLQADDVDDGVRGEVLSGGSVLLLEGEPIALSGYRAHTGNMLWDSARMSRLGARRLVTRLLSLGFHVEEVVDVG